LSFLERLGQGKFAGITLVKGEAGIGKSRLLAGLQAATLEQGFPVNWVVCKADEILREPFNPFRDWLARRLGVSDQQPDEINFRAFDSGLATLLAGATDSHSFGEVMRTASVLAALLNLEQVGSLYEQLDAKGRYDNTLIALASLFLALASQKPVVLVIEDLQWLDPDSLAFLEYLVRLLSVGSERDYPLAIMVTSRPGGSLPPLGDACPLEELSLGSLSAGDISLMAQDLLGAAPGPSLLQLIEERSEGNPFFAEQIVRYLQEHDLLLRDPGGLLQARPGYKASIPADVRAIMIARLDSLPREVREVVQTASILGHEFELNLLASMLRSDSQLDRKVDSAEQASIWFALDEIQYMFRHTLLRDAAYGMQLVARQRHLHALAVDAIEELHAGDIPNHLGELAYHAERANLGERALHYLVQAADSASQSYLNAQGLDYLSRALLILPEDELAHRFDILEKRVELYARIGDRIAQRDDLDSLEQLADRLSDSHRAARALTLRALYYFVVGDYQESIRLAERSIALARSAGEIDASLASYNTWSVSLLRQGRFRTAMRIARDGLELARSRGKRKYEGMALNAMGYIASEDQDADAAEDFLSQALVVAAEIGDRDLRIKAMTNRANVAGFLRGDYVAARDYYQQAYDAMCEFGDRYGQGILLGNLGWASGMQGDLEAARLFHSQSLAISREVGNLYSEAYSLINMSAVALIQGDAETAMAASRQAYDLGLRIGDRTGQSWALLNQGHALMQTGEYEQARDCFERCVQLRLDLDQPGFELEPMAGLTQVALQMDDLETAMKGVEHILSQISGGRNLRQVEEPMRVYFACYQALSRTGDPRSYSVLKDAVELLGKQLSSFRDDAARSRFVESVPWRRAIQDAWNQQSVG
jgi:tetratricopeptide (TPR) repeat protein